MTTTERIYNLSRMGVDIELITMVLRSEGVSDAEIASGYTEVANYTTTEVVRGQYYIRI